MGYWSHWILSAALVSALAGCASPGSTNQALLPSSWPDARYGYDPSLIREDATTLLELDAPLIAQLHSDAVQNLSTNTCLRSCWDHNPHPLPTGMGSPPQRAKPGTTAKAIACH